MKTHLLALAVCMVVGAAAAAGKGPVNPILPLWEHVPDPEPHVFGDRLYIYGSHDAANAWDFCLGDYVGWSAPTNDLGNWRYEGVIFAKKDDPENVTGNDALYAPDVARGPDGRYYLFYQRDNTGAQTDGAAHLGVAVCDRPAGRYRHLGYVRRTDGSLFGDRAGDNGFDPSVLVDDDGRIYLYVGVGSKGAHAYELKPDMLTIAQEFGRVIPGRGKCQDTDFAGHGFVEASSVRKIDGEYVFVYSAEVQPQLCYATAPTPHGPFTYQGVLNRSSCGNHGGLVKLGNSWFITRQRNTNGTVFSRQCCAEKIERTSDGKFLEAPCTSQGFSEGPLPAHGDYPAGITFDGGHLVRQLGEGETADVFVAGLRKGTTVGFRSFDCRGVKRMRVEMRGWAQGHVEVRLDKPDGPLAGKIPTRRANVWRFFEGDVKIPDGVHAIYLVFNCNCLCGHPQVRTFGFAGAGAEDVCRFLESCRQPDGSYAWPGDDEGHLATTHAAAMTYRLLGRSVPGVLSVPDVPSSTSGVWRTRSHAVPLHHYTRLRIELGQPAAIDWARRGGDAAHRKDEADPTDFYNSAYEERSNPILVEEMNKLAVLAGEGKLDEPTRRSFSVYLERRRRANGSYNTTAVADETPEGKACGHVVNTCWALKGRRLLGERADAVVTNFVNGCRNRDGGYTWTDREAPGRVSDITYALAAVEILTGMGVRPADEPSLLAWIGSLRNADGGFGDRPGAASDPLATFAAVETLSQLKRLDILDRPLPTPVAESVPDPALRAWTIQFQAPGSGSVREAVEVARSEKIHLWGAKNANPAWIVAAQAEADRRGVRVAFFRSDERYGERRRLPGLGNFSHVVDPVTPPPGAADGTAFELWQICDHECFARVMLDDGRYDAVGTFHFGCFDMSWLLPFVRRYEGTLALVANQDSHGETWWWREQLRAFRTVFLADEPSFDAFRAACRKGLVASVRNDVHTGGRVRVIGVRPAVKRALLARADEWTAETDMEPAVSVHVLTPADRFEVARPETGRLVRVRHDRSWVEGRGLQPSAYRLERAEQKGHPLSIGRIERRHENNDWMRGILEDAYDAIRIPEGTIGVLTLTFVRRDGSSFVRQVDL